MEYPNIKQGLSEVEAKKRLETDGFNELKEKREITSLKVLLRQFTNFIVYILLAAAIISLFIREAFNFWAILIIIGFVIVLGFIQEYKAEKAMAALKRIIQPKTKVLRDGRMKEIPTKEVVVGDILLLESGDKIPADAEIFQSASGGLLKVDEAALTGESHAVNKQEGEVIFAGTQIVHGKCQAEVIAAGMNTKLGKIAETIQTAEEKTPLQIKITQMAKTLAVIALIASGFAFILGLLKHAPLEEMLMVSLALAVAAVPEGLPLTLTLTLAFGMHRMAKHNAIIRKMLGVETLGSATVICADKTGTITKNEMTVEKIFVDDELFEVSGVGYEPKGDFLLNDKKIDVTTEQGLGWLLKAAAICNNAVLEKKGDEWVTLGDPTEAALLVLGAKANLWRDDLEQEYQRIEEIIFTSERKLMTTINKKGEEKMAFVKGAPEIILPRCKFIKSKNDRKEMDENESKKILSVNREFARSAYRVLAVAYKVVTEPLTLEEIEKDLTFLGLVAMIDPPREEVKEAIATCSKAGIKVVMVTGDNEETAKAIAQKIGLESINAMTGKELEGLPEEELEKVVEDIDIYARIMPEQKLRIVKALKRNGHIVAMTGDGVNDAPALKKADIGVAMGIKGTDVAKESSVMVLQDDNFATIVEAVKQGRTIYENIEKFTCYLISRNFTEAILVTLGILLLGFHYLPLLALHILFINTFGEVMPAIALGSDPTRNEIMLKKPRKRKEGILKKRNLILAVSIATFMAATSFLAFILSNPTGNEVNLVKARTIVFTTIVNMNIICAFSFRSLEESILKIGILKNRLLLIGVVCTLLLTLIVMYLSFFRKIFGIATLSLKDWIVPLSVAFATLIFTEIIKLITKNIK
jgi:Ca2+-transporting ATPase